MSLQPITQKQSTLIAKNIAKVIQNNDMNLLSKSSYNYISICSCFIAHYDLQGFKDHYSSDASVLDFYNDIMDSQSISGRTNYRVGEKDYGYYKSKADTYLLICKELENI